MVVVTAAPAGLGHNDRPSGSKRMQRPCGGDQFGLIVAAASSERHDAPTAYVGKTGPFSPGAALLL
ncbi:MAG: hypothetical protein AAGF84_07230 [Planctomycetota bacterium]